jgi:ribose/xylose/arabinose/galactoside ABC-type transport system permease subunit
MSDGSAIASAGEPAKPRFPRPRRGRFGTDLVAEHRGLLAALAALIAGSLAFARHFASLANLLDILRQMAFTGIIRLGMTLVIIVGEIDISVGPAVAFTSGLFGIVAVNRRLVYRGAQQRNGPLGVNSYAQYVASGSSCCLPC